MTLSDTGCHQARALIARRLGLDFPEARDADLVRGLTRACQASPLPTPEGYLAWLATLPDESPEWRRLAGSLTVGETYFFRDRSCFDALEQHVLPPLIATRRAEGILRLRLWSAGCATGEEPYSLAILLDRLLPDRADWAVTILATDVNPEALEAAGRGSYREWSFRETPPSIRDRYFHRRGAGTFELDARIRRMVTLAPLNLAEASDPALLTNTSAMDLILCRNVLMYFTREAQRAAVARLERSLVSGGWLVVSPAEASIELFRPFTHVSLPGAIFYRKDGASVVRSRPNWEAETVAPDPLPAVPAELPSGQILFSSAARVDSPPDTKTMLRRAQVAADQGELELASHLCQTALVRDRLDPDGYLLLAAICQERDEIPLALEALRRAIYLAPDSTLAHFLMGSLLLRQGKRRGGRRCMETVVRLLSVLQREEAVPGGGGLTAGRLLEMTRVYLESLG